MKNPKILTKSTKKVLCFKKAKVEKRFLISKQYSEELKFSLHKDVLNLGNFQFTQVFIQKNARFYKNQEDFEKRNLTLENMNSFHVKNFAFFRFVFEKLSHKLNLIFFLKNSLSDYDSYKTL